MLQSIGHSSGWGVVSRVFAAILGGYALASAWVVLCGAFRAERVDAIVAGMQTSWLWYVAAIIWAFSPVTLRRIWAWLCLVVVLMLCVAAVLVVWRGQ